MLGAPDRAARTDETDAFEGARSGARRRGAGRRSRERVRGTGFLSPLNSAAAPRRGRRGATGGAGDSGTQSRKSPPELGTARFSGA